MIPFASITWLPTITTSICKQVVNVLKSSYHTSYRIPTQDRGGSNHSSAGSVVNHRLKFSKNQKNIWISQARKLGSKIVKLGSKSVGSKLGLGSKKSRGFGSKLGSGSSGLGSSLARFWKFRLGPTPNSILWKSHFRLNRLNWQVLSDIRLAFLVVSSYVQCFKYSQWSVKEDKII